jgi:hypothetical protein
MSRLSRQKIVEVGSQKVIVQQVSRNSAPIKETRAEVTGSLKEQLTVRSNSLSGRSVRSAKTHSE